MTSPVNKAKWQILEAGYRVYAGLSMSLLSRIDFGVNVYSKDWDVLIILDTARLDAMREVASDFEFLQDVQSIRSLGSTSSEWIAKTFIDEYSEQISETVLVSANPHTQHTLYDRQFPEDDKEAYFSFTDWDTVSPDTFVAIDQVWQYATDDQHDHVLPEEMTQRAVAAHREYQPDKLVVHYMQPHRPHIARALAEGRALTEAERDPFTYLKNGGDRDHVYANHVADLEFVLRRGVKPLLRNVDADRVAITADHGDGFGENWCYAHIAGDPRSQVRKVPWVETEATDHGELSPSLTPPDEAETTTADQLEALGYV